MPAAASGHELRGTSARGQRLPGATSVRWPTSARGHERQGPAAARGQRLPGATSARGHKRQGPAAARGHELRGHELRGPSCVRGHDCQRLPAATSCGAQAPGASGCQGPRASGGPRAPGASRGPCSLVAHSPARRLARSHPARYAPHSPRPRQRLPSASCASSCQGAPVCLVIPAGDPPHPRAPRAAPRWPRSLEGHELRSLKDVG